MDANYTKQLRLPYYILLTVNLLLWPCLLPAQHAVFRHYASREGLPSSEIYCVLQDSKGYMWFGTDRGLVKFDGYSFITYSNTEGLSDNTVFVVKEGVQQRIWYESYSSKLGYLENGKAHPYLFNDLIRRTLKIQQIRFIVPDSNDGFFIRQPRGPAAADIMHINSQGIIKSLPAHMEAGVQYVYISGDGYCLVANRDQALLQTRIIDLQSGKLLAVKELDGPTDTRAFASQLKDGSTVLYLNHALWLLRDNRMTRLGPSPGSILSMTTDKDNNIWLGTFHDGLLLYEARHHYSQARVMLPDLSVSGMTRDKEGGLWFTTLEDGIYYLPPDFCFSYDKSDGLLSAKISSITDIDGQGVLVLSDWHIMRRNNDARFELPRENATSTIQDILYPGPGPVYCAGNGIPPVLFGKQVITFPGELRLQAGISELFGLSNSEVNLYDLQGKRRQSINVREIPRVTCVYRMNDSALLMGTLEGLYLYRDQQVVSLKEKHALLGYRISHIKKLSTHYLLVSTIGQGLLLVHLPEYRVVQYGVKEGLPGMMCTALISQGDSVIWVGTNKGICRITEALHPGQAKFRTADISDGIISNEINDLRIIGNDLWIGTTQGLSIKPLASFGPDTFAIPLHLQTILVNGKDLDSLKSQTLSYRQNNISFSFIAINYQYNSRLRYKYRLQGLEDTSWQFTNTPLVHYNALAPGDYTFEAMTSGTVDTERSLLRYSFRIRAPFWSTWWFLIAIGCLLKVVIYLFVRQRLRFIQEQARIKTTLNDYREKALRLQMNPHFIYNCMNSIQNYIRKNETEASITFLAKFSHLMRMSFHNADVELITLQKDLEALKVYAEMESMRFPGKFCLEIRTDPAINAAELYAPPLLIQPFVENAILHGFVQQASTGLITVSIIKEQQKLKVTITDNGIGIHKALLIRKKKDLYLPSAERKTSGTNITVARIRQSWGSQVFHNMFYARDLSAEDPALTGTLIQFFLPIKYDPDYTR